MFVVTSGRTFRWEAELSESFHETVEPSLWSRQRIGTWVRAMESTCSEGRADIVWGRFGPDHCPKQLTPYAKTMQNATASRILACALRYRSGRTQEELQRCAGVTLPVFRQWLRELQTNGLIVETKDQRFRAGLIRSFPSVEICSFELKLKNWQRALYQATRYRSFSHRVFVVMPHEATSSALVNEDAFRKANVGLISHTPCGASTMLIRPKKRKPQAAFRTIMALGMLSEQSPIDLPSRGMFV